MSIDLRLGDWRTVLADVTCDAMVFDAPYSARTHDSETKRNDGHSEVGLRPQYGSLTSDDVREFCAAWTDRCRGWIVSITDSVLAPVWRQAMEDVGRLTFAPVPCVMRGMTVRLSGDGPSSWAVYAVVGRPRSKEFATWGTLDGAYTGPRGSEAGGGRGKPSWLMNALVRDYSKPGDVVCDPFAGWGSTLMAAVENGRHAIGSEIDSQAFAEAQRRLARPQQIDMFGGAA